MKSRPKKILICEDHQLVIDGLCSIIQDFPSFHVVDTVNDSSGLHASIVKNSPDILLLDLNLPRKNGIEILKDLRVNNPTIKVLVLTMYNKKTIVKKTIAEGANGFLLKNCSSEDLHEALNYVSKEDGFYYGQGVIKAKEEKHTIDDQFYRQVQLTSREKEIIKYLCDGKKVPRIAEIMHISPLTVETHKKNIYKKLGVNSSVKLVTFVHENQLL